MFSQCTCLYLCMLRFYIQCHSSQLSLAGHRLTSRICQASSGRKQCWQDKLHRLAASQLRTFTIRSCWAKHPPSWLHIMELQPFSEGTCSAPIKLSPDRKLSPESTHVLKKGVYYKSRTQLPSFFSKQTVFIKPSTQTSQDQVYTASLIIGTCVLLRLLQLRTTQHRCAQLSALWPLSLEFVSPEQAKDIRKVRTTVLSLSMAKTVTSFTIMAWQTIIEAAHVSASSLLSDWTA